MPCSFDLSQKKGEDRLTIDCRPGGHFLLGVFDGHRTHEVAGHAAQNMPDYVWNSRHWPSAPEEALRTSLRQCHESARVEGLSGGSTAVVVATAGSTIWCCSAGDSRAVAGLRDGGVRRMSTDHTTKNQEELARIKAEGGRVEWNRLGDLPMTRGLGNFSLEADGFTCTPQVTSYPRREIDFIVVASDGLWDVVSDERACALVREAGIALAETLAENLVEEARRLSSEDDIAVIVAFFPPLPEPTAPLCEHPTPHGLFDAVEGWS